MKIGIVLTTRWWRGSIDHDGYASALRALGHEPVLVCLGNDAGKADFPVIETTPKCQVDSAFWQTLGLDGAIVWNWLRGRALLTAARRAGVRTVVRADTDGIVSSRVFAWQSLLRVMGNGVTLRNRLGLASYFFRTILPNASSQDRELLESIEAADAVVVETETASRNLCRVLHYYRRPDLTEKLSVVPHSVCDSITNVSMPVDNAQRPFIFCGGRWDSPQKDVKLLRRTLLRVATRSDLETIVCGPISDIDKHELESLPGKVRCIGHVDRNEIVRILLQSRILLSTSQWETQPIGALEALCCGCTIVAPPIPGFVDMLAGETFGSVSNRRNASGLANACLKELGRWKAGDRKPNANAETWRAKVNNSRVINNLVSLLCKC